MFLHYFIPPATNIHTWWTVFDINSLRSILRNEADEEPKVKGDEEPAVAAEQPEKKKKKEAPKPSPLCAFLLKLQRDLALRAVQREDPQANDVLGATEYIKNLITQALDCIGNAINLITPESITCVFLAWKS